MRTHRAPVIAVLAAVAAFAAGCSTSGNLEEPALSTVAAPTQEDTAEEVVTEVVTKEAPAEESKAEKPKKHAPKKKEKCASLPKDPRDQYPDGSAPGRMPAEDWEDYNFWIGDIENHYDPCAPVSWIIFRGGLGDADHPAQTGASMTNGIAFYVHGEPIDEMTLFTQVESVTANPDGSVDFTWGERTRSTAEGITAYYTATIEPRDGTMVPLSGNAKDFSGHWNEPRNKFLLGHYD